MSRRRTLLAATLIAIPLLAYGVASAVVWDRLTKVSAEDCMRKWGENTPESFEYEGGSVLDTRPWSMPAPVDVRIPSRDPGIELAGW